MNYGTLSEDCDIAQEISFTNNGNLDLVVTDIQQLSSLPQQIEVNYGSLPDFPWTIIPQARISFWTDFTAEGLSLHSLTLKVASNDPREPIKDISAIGETMISTTMIETYTQGTSIYVDIVWIIDNSGSMNSFQNQLSTNFSNFMTLFLSYSPDFQMAFITTDNPSFVGSTHFTQHDINVISDAANLIDSIGTGGSANEKGLEMLYQTLSNNRSWFRQGASLIAIILSDEQDWSANSPQYYATEIDFYYPQGSFLPFAIIGDVPSGCNGAWPGWGYYELVNHYGSAWWSICDADWGTQMEDIALAVINSAAYGLDHPSPKQDSIRVFVNGQELLAGWTYNVAGNSVSFDWGRMPDPGDTVEVSYEIWECE